MNGSRELIVSGIHEVSRLIGDAAEVGVYRGASARLMCELMPESTVWLFDTFKGFPREMISEHDGKVKYEDFTDTSELIVRTFIGKHTNYRIVSGVFPMSAAGIAPQLKFVHIDCDLYKSTQAAIEWAWPLLIPGGVILHDDYNVGTCGGSKKAIDDFAVREGIAIDLPQRSYRAILRKTMCEVLT